MQTLYKELSSYYQYFADFHTETDREVEVLNKFFKQHRVKSVLDVACGIGRHSIPLAKLGYKVIGIDYSPSQLVQAKKKAKQEKAQVRFINQDANTFKFSKKFDAAICMWSTLGEEPLQYEKVIKNVFNSLKAGGIFIIDNRDWSDIPDNKENRIKNKYKDKNLRIEQFIHDRFTDHFRIRDIVHIINGKRYNDLCVTHIIKPQGWVNELKKIGFRKCKIYRNYKKKKTSVLILGRR